MRQSVRWREGRCLVFQYRGEWGKKESWEWAVGSAQLAVGSWQLAVGSGQLAVGSGEWGVLREEREWGVGSGYGVFGLVAER